jgi:ABC-type antimicrobial peptide transport system permease subunit
VIVAECLRGNVFNKIGDIINLNLMNNDLSTIRNSVLTNIATDFEQRFVFQKYKARVVATSRKFPGFFKFSGYKQINMLCPDIVMTKKQLGMIVRDTLSHFPDQHKAYQKKIKQKYPPSTEDLPKSKLYIKVAEGVSR